MLILVFIAFFLSQHSLAKPLPRPDKSSTLETISLDVGAMSVKGSKLLYLPDDQNFLYTSSFKLDDKTQKISFEPLIKAKKYELDKTIYKSTEWSGLMIESDETVLLDGFELIVYHLDKDYKFFRKNHVVWDLILPPKDRLGEAPKHEIAKVRKRFNLEMRVAPDKRIRGIAFKGETDTHREYFASTSAKNFPLVILSCQKSDISNCRVTRECRVDAFKEVSAIHRGGIGYHSKTRRLFLIDKSKNELVVAKHNDCITTPLVGRMTFDKKQKPIASIAINGSKLWLGMAQRDDYYNTMVFTYDLEK